MGPSDKKGKHGNLDQTSNPEPQQTHLTIINKKVFSLLAFLVTLLKQPHNWQATFHLIKEAQGQVRVISFFCDVME